MRFSVWPNMAYPPADTLAIARWADAAGWYGIWFADHYMPNTGTTEVGTGDAHECWALLPAIAAVTERLRVGSLVAPTSVHHPAVLANRAVTLDHLSGGRMVLGIGAGWQINEHRAYGIELEPPRRRVDRFAEAIQVIRSLLAQDRTTFDGSHYRLEDAPANPKPLQSPLPILVGTSGRRMLRLTARHADEWNTWGNPDVAAERRRAFEQACTSEGRDPGALHTSVQALVELTDDPGEAQRAVAGDPSGRTMAGDAEQVREQLERYAALGFDEFILPTWNLGASNAERLDRLARFHEEVVARW